MSHFEVPIRDIPYVSLSNHLLPEAEDGSQGPPPDFVRDIAALLVPGQRVLEICAGDGRLSPELVRTGADVTPVDLSSLDLENLRASFQRHPSLKVPLPVVASPANLPFLDESFDAVVAGDRFGLTGELRSAMNEAHRVLKPGGLFLPVVLTPADAAFGQGEQEAVGVWIHEGTLRHFFTRRQFRGMCRHLFQVCKAWPVQWPTLPHDHFIPPGRPHSAHVFVLRKA